MSLEVVLSEDQSEEIKNSIFQLIKEAVDDASINVESKTWMRKFEAVEYVSMSPKSFKSKFEDLPVHELDGLKLYNKSEIDEFIMEH